MSPQLNPINSQLIPAQRLTSYSLRFALILSCQLRLGPLCDLFFADFPTKMLRAFIISPKVPQIPLISSYLILLA